MMGHREHDGQPIDLRTRQAEVPSRTKFRRELAAVQELPTDQQRIVEPPLTGVHLTRICRNRKIPINTLRRRVRNITARLRSSQFDWVRRNEHRLTKHEAAVARSRWIEGKSLRTTAQELRLSVWQVRCIVEALRRFMRYDQDDERAREATS